MFIIDLIVNLMCYGIGAMLSPNEQHHISSDHFVGGVVLGETMNQEDKVTADLFKAENSKLGEHCEW